MMNRAILRARLALIDWRAAVGRALATERGASLVEYALLVALIALVCFAAVGFLGGAASSQYEGVGSSLANSN
jgi:pilus assembly protein Flp/PilA